MEQYKEDKDKKIYQEYVELLQYFAKAQPSRYDIIEVIFFPDGKHILIDQEGHKIKSPLVDVAELYDYGYSDLLVGELLHYSPNRIILTDAQFANEFSIRALKDIFGEIIKIN